MSHDLQIPTSEEELRLHRKYGHPGIEMIRGAGMTNRPTTMFLFMNPTARNIASNPDWNGIRAPWIGVKPVWQMFSDLGLIDKDFVPTSWNNDSALMLYRHIADRKLYITNLSSCTQPDARLLPSTLFRDYLPIARREIERVKPKRIITFGNQVSSFLLQKTVSVSSYSGLEDEWLIVGDLTVKVYPTYYPMGQGRRNLSKAMQRITLINNGS